MKRSGALVAGMSAALLLSFGLTAGVAQTTPSLPPEAQMAFERGLAAVQQQDWGLAIRYFSQAHRSAQESPAILFNLGLAHGKAGNEVAAMAWHRIPGRRPPGAQCRGGSGRNRQARRGGGGQDSPNHDRGRGRGEETSIWAS